jgi:hypothetical protein
MAASVIFAIAGSRRRRKLAEPRSSADTQDGVQRQQR